VGTVNEGAGFVQLPNILTVLSELYSLLPDKFQERILKHISDTSCNIIPSSPFVIIAVSSDATLPLH
jgi:hypothetical protein